MATGDAQLINLVDYLKGLPVSEDESKVDCLLLTCIDYRFFALIGRMMAGIKYDHVTLAGAALGAVVEFPPKPQWEQYFFEHLALAIRLHKIGRVVIMEHRDCGAYREFGLLPDKPDPERERAVHQEQVDKLTARITRRPPGLPVSSLLLPVPEAGVPFTFDRLMVERLT